MAEQEKADLMEPSFLSIVMMLSASATSYLQPETGRKETEKKPDLPLARYTIDLLGVLERKTAGNLTQEEKEVLDNVLADLRMLYVKASCLG